MRVIIASCFISLLFLIGCSANYLNTGDKPYKDIELSLAQYQAVIDEYICLVDVLEGEIEVLRLVDSNSVLVKQKIQKILDYQAKINLLEESRDRFLGSAAGKDRFTLFELKSDKPVELAQAYWLIRNADNSYIKGPDSGLVGVIINKANVDALVRITNPAGQVLEVLVDKRSEVEISLSMTGVHRVDITSIANNSNRQPFTFTKEVGPTSNYLLRGQRKDLLVTITSK